MIVALSLAHKHRHKQTSTKRKKIKGEKYKEDKPGGLRDNDNNKVLKTPSIYRSIHPFFYAHPGLGRGGSSLTKDAQTFLSPANYSSLSGGNTKAFPGQLRDLISQAGPGSALGPPSSRIFPEHLNQELPRSHPSQMSKPLQLAPFNVEVQ